MASTVIMIGTDGPDPAYQDGDPLEVFNNRRTLIDFAQRIVRPVNKQELKGFTSDGPLKNFLERVSQYRFEHISKDVIKRTDIKANTSVEHTYPTLDIKLGNYDLKRYVMKIDMQHLIFTYLFDVGADLAGYKAVRSGKAILITDLDGLIVHYDLTLVYKEYAHVKQAVAANIKSKLPVFGSPDKEIWYGGRTDYSMPTTQLCWDDIENDNPDKKRADHKYMDYSNYIKERFLCLPIIDVDDITAAYIVAKVEDTPDSENSVTIKKRACNCKINALELSKATIKQIRDMNQIVDIMEVETDIDHSTIISLKS